MVAALHNLKKIFAAILPSWRGYQLEDGGLSQG
jgi:hypothetical protein